MSVHVIDALVIMENNSTQDARQPLREVLRIVNKIMDTDMRFIEDLPKYRITFGCLVLCRI